MVTEPFPSHINFHNRRYFTGLQVLYFRCLCYDGCHLTEPVFRNNSPARATAVWLGSTRPYSHVQHRKPISRFKLGIWALHSDMQLSGYTSALIPWHFMWDLWWAEWRCGSLHFFKEYFSFSPCQSWSTSVYCYINLNCSTDPSNLMTSVFSFAITLPDPE
jgi:hypothetical protein